jgi:hypothetical protein
MGDLLSVTARGREKAQSRSRASLRERYWVRRPLIGAAGPGDSGTA